MVWFSLYSGLVPNTPEEPLDSSCRQITSFEVEPVNAGPAGRDPLHDWVEFAGIDPSASSSGTCSFGRLEPNGAAHEPALALIHGQALGLSTPHIMTGAHIMMNLKVSHATALAALRQHAPIPAPVRVFDPEAARLAIEAADAEFGPGTSAMAAMLECPHFDFGGGCWSMDGRVCGRGCKCSCHDG